MLVVGCGCCLRLLFWLLVLVATAMRDVVFAAVCVLPLMLLMLSVLFVFVACVWCCLCVLLGVVVDCC